MVYIAKYILRSEYQCKCCSELPPDYDEPYDLPFDIFFDSFALIRERWGAPLNITSGYRCPRHNSFIGGHPLSVHQFGLAFDVSVEPHEIDKLDNIVLEETPDLRVGRYPSYIHIDAGFLIYPRASEAWKQGQRWSNP
jgi:hypothetical protein